MHRCGYRVRAVASRTAASAERLAAAIPGCEAASPQEVADRCDTVFLTVPDDAIGDVAASLRWRAGQSVVHCSGALPLDVLSPAAQSGGAATEAGAIGGAMHPLQTFTAGVDPTAAFQGIACAIEAPAPLRGALDELADAARRVADLAVLRGPGALPRQRHRRVRPHRHAAEAGRRPLERHSRAGGAGDASPASAYPQHAQQHRAAGVAGGADRPRGPRRRWRRADAPRRPVGAGAWLLAAVRSPVAGVAADRPGEGDARRTAGSAAARAAVGLPTAQANTQHEGAPCV